MPQQILVEEKFWYFQYFALSDSEWLTRPKFGEVYIRVNSKRYFEPYFK